MHVFLIFLNFTNPNHSVATTGRQRLVPFPAQPSASRTAAFFESLQNQNLRQKASLHRTLPSRFSTDLTYILPR